MPDTTRTQKEPAQPSSRRVPRRVSQALIQSLKGGVVPRVGLPYITVGRSAEIEALLRDVEIVSEGGSSFRFIVGRYGSGKSFLLQTIRNNVMDRGFVVMDADLSPERRLTGTRGQGLATYRELISNLATKTRPEGGALTLVLDRWIDAVRSREGADPSEKRIREIILSLGEMVHGIDFAHLITLYFRASMSGDDEARGRVIKWLRGEYATRTEARRELGVNAIITDDDWYDYLKLFASFFRLAGYKGLVIFIDELVNIYKIPQSVARNSNYEKILTMYNDTLQGKARYLGILMSGTQQCVEDTRRGIYSYEALRSRLAEGKFSCEGARDMLAPVIRLEPLTSEEMLVLCEKLADLHASLYNCQRSVTTADLAAFIRIEYGRIGADSHITPREVIRDFIELLDILYQHPGKTAQQILGSDAFSYAQAQMDEGDDVDEAFADFIL